MKKEQPNSVAAVLANLDRLWQIKIQSVSLLADWQKQTKDQDIRAGLNTQLIDERRHLRLVGEEIRRLGGRVTSERRESAVGHAIGIARSQESDVLTMCAFYRGVKLFTLGRCGQLMQFVDAAAAVTLEQISHDDERHIRWADIRIANLMRGGDMRDCNAVMGRVESSLAASWQKSWLELRRSQGHLSS